jgi:hypothetical protein
MILPALNRLCCGAMDPGLRRDDDNASVCAQFDYTLSAGRRTHSAQCDEELGG